MALPSRCWCKIRSLDISSSVDREVSRRSMVQSKLPISVLFHSQDGAHVFATASDRDSRAMVLSPG